MQPPFFSFGRTKPIGTVSPNSFVTRVCFLKYSQICISSLQVVVREAKRRATSGVSRKSGANDWVEGVVQISGWEQEAEQAMPLFIFGVGMSRSMGQSSLWAPPPSLDFFFHACTALSIFLLYNMFWNSVLLLLFSFKIMWIRVSTYQGFFFSDSVIFQEGTGKTVSRNSQNFRNIFTQNYQINFEFKNF